MDAEEFTVSGVRVGARSKGVNEYNQMPLCIPRALTLTALTLDWNLFPDWFYLLIKCVVLRSSPLPLSALLGGLGGGWYWGQVMEQVGKCCAGTQAGLSHTTQQLVIMRQTLALSFLLSLSIFPLVSKDDTKHRKRVSTCVCTSACMSVFFYFYIQYLNLVISVLLVNHEMSVWVRERLWALVWGPRQNPRLAGIWNL